MALELEVAIGQVLDAEEISNQILILISELSISFESRSFEIKIRVGIL